jgi:hypothetical protein
VAEKVASVEADFEGAVEADGAGDADGAGVVLARAVAEG